MRSIIIRSLPTLNLIVNITYLFVILLITQREVNENLETFNDFLNKDGRLRKVAVERKSQALGSTSNKLTNAVISKPNKSLYYILDWTTFYDDPMTDDYLSEECPDLPCRVTTDRRLLHHSAAVVFHPPDTRVTDWPLWRSPFQSYVLALWESPTSVIDVGWANLHKYDCVFNLTMTFRLDSDIPAPYGRLSKLETRKPANEFNDELQRLVQGKSKLVAWFVSHCSTRSEREKFASELQKYMPVDIYGSCGTLTCGRFVCDERRLLKDYKFYLSFENSICKDYVTEKFYDRLLQDVVPVVLGGSGNFVSGNDFQYPRDGFILATNFSSMKDLADYLLYLDSHPDEYAKYFQWKRDYEAIMSWPKLFQRAYCQLCRKVMWISGNYTTRRQSYDDMYYWWHEKYGCDDDLVGRFLKRG